MSMRVHAGKADMGEGGCGQARGVGRRGRTGALVRRGVAKRSGSKSVRRTPTRSATRGGGVVRDEGGAGGGALVDRRAPSGGHAARTHRVSQRYGVLSLGR